MSLGEYLEGRSTQHRRMAAPWVAGQTIVSDWQSAAGSVRLWHQWVQNGRRSRPEGLGQAQHCPVHERSLSFMLKIEWLYVGVITPNPTDWNTKQSEIQSSVGSSVLISLVQPGCRCAEKTLVMLSLSSLNRAQETGELHLYTWSWAQNLTMHM